jgi:hypothetical protein
LRSVTTLRLNNRAATPLHTADKPPEEDGCHHFCTFYQEIIIYVFTSRSGIFHVYGDDTIAGEGLQNLGLCSALRAFE